MMEYFSAFSPTSVGQAPYFASAVFLRFFQQATAHLNRMDDNVTQSNIRIENKQPVSSCAQPWGISVYRCSKRIGCMFTSITCEWLRVTRTRGDQNIPSCSRLLEQKRFCVLVMEKSILHQFSTASNLSRGALDMSFATRAARFTQDGQLEICAILIFVTIQATPSVILCISQCSHIRIGHEMEMRRHTKRSAVGESEKYITSDHSGTTAVHHFFLFHGKTCELPSPKSGIARATFPTR